MPAEGGLQRVGDLSDRRLGARGIDGQGQQIVVAARPGRQGGQSRLRRRGLPSSFAGASIEITLKLPTSTLASKEVNYRNIRLVNCHAHSLKSINLCG
jgi:hypothetical protein